MTAVLEADTQQLRRVFGAFPTGVTAVAVERDGQPIGMAASSFTSVSLYPPLVSINVSNSSETWPLLAGSPRLGVSVLSEDQEQACRQLAGPSADRFTGLSWDTSPDGALRLDGASAWLDCSIAQVIPAGGHLIVVLAVHEFSDHPQSAPLVFHASQYRRLNL
ncbi:MAG: flavin reductase family protein [Propionibacteriaceae bacterium]